MKRLKTEDANIFIGPKGVRYYRKGDFERSLETTSQREAVKRKKALEAKIDVFGQQAYKLTVNDVLKDFFDERYREVQSGTIRLDTYLEFEDLFRLHLMDFFGRKRFADIDEPLWDEYVARKSELDLSNHRKVFGYFLAWAKRKQYYRYIPDLKIPPPQRRQRKVLTPETCRKILSNSHGSLRLFIAMYLFMGMRRSEIIKLSWMRVNLERGFITLYPENTKTKRFRVMPINQFVWALLKERRQRQAERNAKIAWVFPNLKDEKRHADVSGLKTAWHTCLKRSGLVDADIQWHDLRATHQYYTHKRIDFTDTQREKFSGSSIEVQKRHYVSFEADDLKGLEEAVQFEGLDSLLEKALSEEVRGENTGKLLGAKKTRATKDLK